jgi:hypothetical protein
VGSLVQDKKEGKHCFSGQNIRFKIPENIITEILFPANLSKSGKRKGLMVHKRNSYRQVKTTYILEFS